MSKYLTLCVAGFVGLVVVIFLFGLFSFRSNVITLDKRFEAQYLSNQSSYDSINQLIFSKVKFISISEG